MTNLTYPDSFWYTLNNVYYWPYRGRDFSSDLSYPLERGAYRYFRYNIQKKYAGDLEKKAAAACIRVSGMSCYEIGDGTRMFCEGFLEPECEGVTLGHLVQYLYPSEIEVCTESIWALEEAISDLDDFLNLEYPEVKPVTLAGPDEKLLTKNYYAVAAFYKGRRPTTLYRAPVAAEADALLSSQGMGFYQPYPSTSTTSIAFVLYTAERKPTPRELADLLMADYVAVNLNPLDADEQRVLHDYDAGANFPAAITRFFQASGKGASDIADILAAIAKNMKYAAYAGLGLATIYAGFQVYKITKEKGNA